MATKRKTVAKKKSAPKREIVHAYKAFNSDLTCRGFQFELGKTYKHKGRVSICSRGFHAVENPLDMFSYYDITNFRAARVELSGSIQREADDSKICGAKLTIGVEIELPEIISETVKYLTALCAGAKDGESASGYSSTQAASGNYSRQAASGDYSKQAASGKNGVIVAAGRDGQAKGADGAWISLAEYDCGGLCIGFGVGCAGRDGVPVDTWLKASGGKLVAA